MKIDQDQQHAGHVDVLTPPEKYKMKSITKRWPRSYLVVGVIPQRLSNQARDIVTEGREKLEEEFWSNELSFDSLVRLRISSSTSRKQMRIFHLRFK